MSPNSISMLELKKVKKAYHSKPILQVDSFTLEKGIYHLKGANGTGKTTLLKMIAGLLPFDGDIVFQSISQKKSPVHYRQQLSWAEAEPLYPAFITGRDLLELYRDIRGIQKNETGDLVISFNMAEYIDEPVGTYSAGMTKKLSLLLAFTGLPSICLLDEPFITLDDASAAFIADLVIDEHRRKGTTFIISSHQEIDFAAINSGEKISIINQSISREPF